MSFFTCVQMQLPESHGNGETTLEKWETNPLDVPLDDIAENLSSFLNGFKSLREAKKVIEKKYKIKKEHGDCWPADDIKRAWGQTQRMNIKSSRRRYWAHVIILQMLKRFMVYDECKQNAAHENHDDTTNDINQSCETRSGMKENPEDTSSQSKAELQVWRADLHAFKHKLIEQSSAVLESQLSAPITDVATSPAELREKICYSHSNSNESMNAALVNENEDTLDNNCEPRKSIDNCEELNFTGMPERMKAERENGRGEDGLWSAVDSNQACGKAESMKENSEDRSSQSSAELETVGAAGEDKHSSGANRKLSKSGLNQTGSVSQGQSGKQCSTRSQATRNDPGAPGGRSSSGVSKASEKKAAVKKCNVDETIYIHIPFSAMFDRETAVLNSPQPVVHNAKYKLIDGFPSNTDIRKRKSYVMSFSNETNNAEWVYEILNKETLKKNCVEPETFGDGYDRGHLAPTANHRWCREAYNDVNLYSNIIPQNSTLNRGMWRMLEGECREKIQDTMIRNVHVYTGPLYIGHCTLLGEKSVPNSFFKIRIVENNDGTVQEPECYVIPNETPRNTDLNSYKTDIKYIQTVSKLTFTEHITNLRKEDITEAVTLQGKDLNERPCNVNITVRITKKSQ